MTAQPTALHGARVLVTGGSGLIGTAVVTAFLDRGAQVVVLDRRASRDLRAEHRDGDICDSDDVNSAVSGCDVVVHLAGIPGLDHDDALGTYRINTVGTFAVLTAACEAAVPKVVYASSINAAGWPLHPGDVYPPRYPFDEDSAREIGDWYSLSKVANEDAALMLSSRFPQTNITGLRYPLVRDIAGDTTGFGVHLRSLMRTDPARAAKEGWSYLDVSDAARATVAAAERRTPAATGILVAAPRTYLSTPTAQALMLTAPHVPASRIEGTDVPIDLSRSRELLAFEAEVLLDELAPEILVEVEGTGGA